LHFAAGLGMRGFPVAGLEVPQVAMKLLACRAEANAVGGRLHHTPLAIAAATGRAMTLEFLVDGATFGSALLEATPSCVSPLVRAGCDPNRALSCAGLGVAPPLCVAAGRGQVQKVEALLAAKADVGRCEGTSGCCALHYAVLAAKGQLKEKKRTFEQIIAHLLRGQGADPLQADKQGRTPVDCAVRIKWFDAKRLLDAHVKEARKKQAEAQEEKVKAQVEAMRGVEKDLVSGASVDGVQRALESAGPDAKEWGALVSSQNRAPPPTLSFAERRPGASIAMQQRDAWRTKHAAPLLLHAAAAVPALCGPIGICKLLVDEAGFDPTLKDRIKCETPLFSASGAGSAEVCSFFLDAKCDVNETDASGQTPLFHAARTGSLSALRVLLQAGGAADAEDRGGRRPLALAAHEGADAGVLRELVAWRADVNATDANGWSAVFLAVRETRAQAAALLLGELGAGPPRRWDKPVKSDNAGNSDIFHMAQERGLDEVVRLLEAARERHNLEAEMFEVAGSGPPARLAELLARGLDANAAGEDGQRPLHRAAARRDGHAFECCRHLLEQHRADPSVRDRRSKETPLFAAARGGLESCVRAMLSARGDAGLADARGETALFAAARPGHNAVVAALLGQGAPAGHCNRDGQTALFCAGDARCAELLLEGRCDPHARDAQDQTALFPAAKAGLGDLIGVLLRAGAEADARSREGTSALHLASGGRAPRALAAAGADVRVEDHKYQQTPLFLAAGRFDTPAVSALFAASADLRRRDSYNRTALEVAAKIAPLEVVATLVREGGPVTQEMLDRARKAAISAKGSAQGDEQRGQRARVAEYLANVCKSRRFSDREEQTPRRRYVLVCEDPTTGERLTCGTPAYEAELKRFCEESGSSGWPHETIGVTQGPTPVADL